MTLPDLTPAQAHGDEGEKEFSLLDLAYDLAGIKIGDSGEFDFLLGTTGSKGAIKLLSKHFERGLNLDEFQQLEIEIKEALNRFMTK